MLQSLSAKSGLACLLALAAFTPGIAAADDAARISRLETEIQQLRSQLDEQNRRIQRLEAELARRAGPPPQPRPRAGDMRTDAPAARGPQPWQSAAAWTRVEQRFTSSNMANVFVPRADDSRNDEGIVSQGVWGVQAGGGAEVRVAERWTVVAEYLYSRFDDRDDAVVRSTRGTAPATNPFVLVNPGGTDLRRTEPLTMGTVRVGIQYRF